MRRRFTIRADRRGDCWAAPSRPVPRSA